MPTAQNAHSHTSRAASTSARWQTADAAKVVIVCLALGVAGYLLLRATGLFAADAPSREQARELEAEQAELQRLAPPQSAPTEVKLLQGGAPG